MSTELYDKLASELDVQEKNILRVYKESLNQVRLETENFMFGFRAGAKFIANLLLDKNIKV